MDENELKAAFAAFLLETPNYPLEAAIKLYPADRDRGEACRISFAWPSDPVVVMEMERLKKDGYRNKDIPTKEDAIKEMWRLAQNDRVLPKDRAVLVRLIAEMLSFIPKNSEPEEKERMPMKPAYRIVEE